MLICKQKFKSRKTLDARLRELTKVCACVLCVLTLSSSELFLVLSAVVIHENNHVICTYPRAVVEDVLAAVTHVHVSGKMHQMVLGDIGRQDKYGIDFVTVMVVLTLVLVRSCLHFVFSLFVFICLPSRLAWTVSCGCILLSAGWVVWVAGWPANLTRFLFFVCLKALRDVVCMHV